MVNNIHNPLAFGAGLLGNLISLLVLLSPVPTFCRVCKKRSTESFHSVPYVVALFSALLWLYYAILTIDFLVLTINSLSCFTECIYLMIYLVYAPKKAKMFTLKLILLLDVGFCGSLVLSTLLFLNGRRRVNITGCICASLAVAVFIAPLKASDKNQKCGIYAIFMPFPLSFFLTLSAVAWFGYGLLIRDIFVTVPNVVGFLFGMAQIILYFVYVNPKKDAQVSELTNLEKDQMSATISTPNVEEINKSNISEIDIERSEHLMSQTEKCDQ